MAESSGLCRLRGPGAWTTYGSRPTTPAGDYTPAEPVTPVEADNRPRLPEPEVGSELATKSPGTDRHGGYPSCGGGGLSGNGRYACNGSCQDMPELLARLHEQASPSCWWTSTLIHTNVGEPGAGGFNVRRVQLRRAQQGNAKRVGSCGHAGGGAELRLENRYLPRLPAMYWTNFQGSTPESSGKGVIITVLSAAGGCGCNDACGRSCRRVAAGLRRAGAPDRPGHFPRGVGAYLGLDGQYSLADVLSHNGAHRLGAGSLDRGKARGRPERSAEPREHEFLISETLEL